ncbi:hypothetical protein OHA72_27915 [Dactylosporangium sp. NBC_01737]|uniref:hypothetical protein n=1 Tax=Dactylosporangium sp. NBC_01737 TaxID=2975959 RepID=UPI002E1111A0|nr:hypothetical protein OHA72_27915 [Dactylosporangium sp. NBC_01737]
MRMQDLVELATSEPPPLRYGADELLASGRRVQRRRRLGWAASGTAAVAVLGVVAAVVAVPALTGKPEGTPGAEVAQQQQKQQPVAATAEPFTFTFGGYRVGKLRVEKPIDVSTAYQLASVYADGLITNDKPVDPNAPAVGGPNLYAYLTVYRAGAYDPSKLAGAQQVTVGGRPGLEVNDQEHGWAARRTLAWQYATDAWAVLRASSDDAAFPSAKDLRDLAAGLPGITPAPAKLPVKLSYVPAGYHLAEVSVHAMPGLNGIASAREGDYAGLVFSNPALPTTGLSEPFGGEDGNDPPGSFQIFVVPAANSNQQPSPGLSCGDGFCNRWVNGVNIQVSSGKRLPDTEMKKILQGVTLGNVQDDSTWTAVTP